MDIFFQELKRQFSVKRFLVYTLISIMLAGLWAWFIVGGRTEDFMQLGAYKEYKGKAAIDMAAKDRNVTAGEMTEEKFQSACDIFLKSLKGDDESDIVLNKDLLQHAVYTDKLVMQEFRLRSMNGESTEGLLHIPKDSGKNFYKNEDLYYRKYINDNALNENEKKIALSNWNSVKKPYTYYAGFETWSDGIGHITFLSFVLMIMAATFAGAIIAKDKENGIDEIITTTVKGKNHLAIAKITIPLIMASIIYLCGVGIYIVLLKNLLPDDALKTSLQVFSTSFIKGTERDILRTTFIFGAIAILTITSFSTWISSIVKKSSSAIQLSVLIILSSFILGIFINIDSKIIDIINAILPGGMLFLYPQFLESAKFPFTTILGNVFWIPSILIIISLIILVLSIIFTSLNYRRR